MSWRREFDQLLIDSIQKYPYIYNVALEEFRNVNVKTDAWQAVAHEVGTNGELFTSSCRSRLPTVSGALLLSKSTLLTSEVHFIKYLMVHIICSAPPLLFVGPMVNINF